MAASSIFFVFKRNDGAICFVLHHLIYVQVCVVVRFSKNPSPWPGERAASRRSVRAPGVHKIPECPGALDDLVPVNPGLRNICRDLILGARDCVVMSLHFFAGPGKARG